MPKKAKRKRVRAYIFIAVLTFLAVNIYSLMPVLAFYLKGPAPVKMLNEDVVELLKANKEPYFNFIVISDTGSGIIPTESATLKLISNLNREDRFKKVPIDFVLNIGDLTFRGTEPHYENYIKLKNMIKWPVIDAIGNHDDDMDNGERGMALFHKYSGKEEFSFVDRNSYFIVLDDKDGNLKEGQFKWLEEELEKAQNYKHTFIFMHKPPFNPFQATWYRVELSPWSHRFMKLCDLYGVRIVFSGHEDAMRVAKFGTVTYIVTAGGGSLMEHPTSEGGFLNYFMVKVNHDYVDYEMRKVNPPVWEFFLYYMWKDLWYFVKSWSN